jgi:hypothetical protein
MTKIPDELAEMIVIFACSFLQGYRRIGMSKGPKDAPASTGTGGINVVHPRAEGLKACCLGPQHFQCVKATQGLLPAFI